VIGTHNNIKKPHIITLKIGVKEWRILL